MDTSLSSVLNENVDRLFRELIVDRNNKRHVAQKLRFPRKRKLSVDEPFPRDGHLKEDFRSQRSFSNSGEEVGNKKVNGYLERKFKGGNLYVGRNISSSEGCGIQHLLSTSDVDIGNKTKNNDFEKELQGRQLCITGKSEPESISRNNVNGKKDILFPYSEVVTGLNYSTTRENEDLLVLETEAFPKVENWYNKNTMQSDLMDKLYSDFMNGVHLKNKLKRPKSKRQRHSEGTSCDWIDYHGNNTYPENYFGYTNVPTEKFSDKTIVSNTESVTVAKNEIISSNVENVDSCALDVTRQFSKSGTEDVLINTSHTELEQDITKLNKTLSVEPNELVQDQDLQVQIDELIPGDIKNSNNLLSKTANQDTGNSMSEKFIDMATESVNLNTENDLSEKLYSTCLPEYETKNVNDLHLDKKNSENESCILQLNNKTVENASCVGDTESAISSVNKGGPENVKDTQLFVPNSINTDKGTKVKKTKINSSKNSIKSRIIGRKDKIPKTKMTRNRLNSFNLIFPEPPPEGLWRSKRTRVPPLEWHKNERIIYDCGVVSGITISSEARIKQLEEQKALQRAKEKRENNETLNKSDKRKQHSVSEHDQIKKKLGKSHTIKPKEKQAESSKNRDKQLVRKIIKNSEKYLIEHGKNNEYHSKSKRHSSASVRKSNEKCGLSKKSKSCESHHDFGKPKVGLNTKKKLLEDKIEKAQAQSSDKDSKSRLSKMFENKKRKNQKNDVCIKFSCSHKPQKCNCKVRQKKRSVTKRAMEMSSKKKEMCNTQILTQEVILRSHEENMYSENGNDTFRTLSCLEDKDQIEAHDLELLMPSTESVKWSNGSRMFSSLGLFDTESKISHPGGIWKSVVQEQ